MTELRKLYDEVHEAYLVALEAHRRANKLERRYKEVLYATCKELARLHAPQGELTGDGASARAPGAPHPEVTDGK